MKNQVMLGWVVVGLAAVGCGPEQNAAQVQISESSSRLLVVGQDVSGRIARVEVKAGRFLMSEGFAEDRAGEARNVEGRQVEIDVGGVRLHHESEGYQPLRLPLPPGSEYLSMHSFLADPRVQPALQSWGVSFDARSASRLSRTAPRATDMPASPAFVERCSDFDAHTAGPGIDCQQWSGNDPNGFSVNTCASLGVNSAGCSVISEKDASSYSGYYTDLFQCCTGSSLGAAEKTCVPQAKGVSPCGTGGTFGCAVCWNVSNLSRCRTWCEGSGDDCGDSGNSQDASACFSSPLAQSGIEIAYR